MFSIRFLLTIVFVICNLSTSLAAESWTQFRGSDFGATSATELPVEWSSKNVSWKTALPGPGASSPVIYDGAIYLTCYTGYGVDVEEPGEPLDLQRHLLCIQANNGQIVWQKTIGAVSAENEFNDWAVALHGYASSTPAVDATGVYVFFGDAGCFAFDHDGHQRWQFACGKENHAFGSGASPILYNDLVIVNASPESESLIAINKLTGKEIWRQSEILEAWNTPVIYTNLNGAHELALSVEGKVLAYDPEDGQARWSCEAIDDYICPSIVADDGILYAIGGRDNTTVAIRSGGAGDVTESHKLWELGKGSNVPSPVIHDGHLYWAKEKGIVYCANVSTGEMVYEERLKPKSGLIYASPLLVNGNLYYVSREKGTYVVAAQPQFELVSHNIMEEDDSVFNANPVPLANGFLLRSNKFLYYLRKEMSD